MEIKDEKKKSKKNVTLTSEEERVKFVVTRGKRCSQKKENKNKKKLGCI